MTPSEDQPDSETSASSGEVPPPPAAGAGTVPPPSPGAGPGWKIPPQPARPGSAVGEYLRTTISRAGLESLGWVAGAVVAPALLSAICLVGALGAARGGALDFGSLVLGLLVGMGMVLGSGVAARADVDAGFAELSGSAAATIFALGTLVAVSAMVAVVARIRLRKDRVFAPTPGAELLRAGIEAGAIALVLTLLTGFARLGGASMLGDVAVTARPGSVFFVVLLVVFVTLFVARQTATPRERSGAGGASIRLLRETGRFFAVQGAVFGAVALAVLVVVAVQAESFAVFFALLPFVGNVAVIASALGYGGGVTAAATLFDGESIYAWDIVGGHSAWLFVLTALSIVAAAGVVGVKRTRGVGPDWSRVWQLPLVVFGVWFLLAVGLAGLRLSGELASVADLSGGGSISLGWGVPFLMGLGAAAVSVAAEFVPTWVFRMNPAWLAFFGGRRAAHAWLAGAPQEAQGGQAPENSAVSNDTAVLGDAAVSDDTATLNGTEAASTAILDPSEFETTAVPAETAVPGDTKVLDGTAILQHMSAADTAVLDSAAFDGTTILDSAAVPDSGDAADGNAATAGAATPAAGSIPEAAYSTTANGVPPLPERQPMSRKAKRALLATVISVGAVGLLIGAAAVTIALINQSRDPAAPVEAYLSLLERGEAERATELVDPGLPNDDRVLLADDVLGAADHRIEVVEVITQDNGEENATVTATLSLDGERFEHSFPVVAGPKEFLFLNTWELREPLLSEVTISSDGTDVLTIGETEITLAESEFGGTPSRSFYAYPGIYSVTGAANDYVTVSTEQLRALPGRVADATVTNEPSETLQKLVLAQVQARITQCTEIPTNMDDVCPYITRDDKLAELTVVTQAAGFDEIDLTSFTASEAEIAVRPNPTRFDSDPDLRETTFNARGTIEFVDGEPRVTDLTLGW